MAQLGIREYKAKKMLSKVLKDYSLGKISYSGKVILVKPETNFSKLLKKNSWLKKEKLVVKPDMLFGKRGKLGLIGLNFNYSQIQKWIQEKTNKKIKINKTEGYLTHFIIEPFVPHNEEYYISIQSERDRDIIYFSYKGGIEIEDNWDKVMEIPVSLSDRIDDINLDKYLKDDKNRDILKVFIKSIYKYFIDYNFSFLEINPFTFIDEKIIPLDMVAKVDDTASFESTKLWGDDIEFPSPFGRALTKEEEYIKNLDENTGASLKLTLLNPEGKVWTMVAGGGASVIYADTISDLGFGSEMANYGEYSGNPSTDETYEYAKTVLDLMTRKKVTKGKVLIIGGGIANFTDVAKTFTGIIKALEKYKDKIKKNNIRIYIRRGGPNYQEGLRKIKAVGEELGIPLEAYGPETHMTEIVKLAVDTL